ncbi:hypothetical protein [Haloarchaeobius sp. DT45]|uniref:hypothetical protein n=1 Tax=Haloarchaeobius sp. DT45 TaxID=3446116 RepID=UPI003F6DA001
MTGVDWPALFREFGLNKPDAADHRHVSRTRLTLALSATDQDVRGGSALITQAARRGELDVRTATSPMGNEFAAGYLPPSMLSRGAST